MSDGYPRRCTSSLALVATSHALRFDAKYADPNWIKACDRVREAGHFQLGDFLPHPFVKGKQPVYMEPPADDAVLVVNTASIQRLAIHRSECKHISLEDYKALDPLRQLGLEDVLLTVDGGVSIGKPVLFDLDEPATMDSHVVVLRPAGLAPLSLVYLLASPLGQLHFRRAESGASGQTGVTEDDVRRFVFPREILATIEQTAKQIQKVRDEVAAKRARLDEEEEEAWSALGDLMAP